MRGKVALISGAARGQGEAEARLFVAEGARVVLGDVRHELGEKVAASLGEAARYVPLDVAKEDHWPRAVGLAEDVAQARIRLSPPLLSDALFMKGPAVARSANSPDERAALLIPRPLEALRLGVPGWRGRIFWREVPLVHARRT